MTEHWFHERTEDGWEIRDENRLLVAIVPDVQHERETDAELIAGTNECACLADALGLVRGHRENEVAHLRRKISALVADLVVDSQALVTREKSEGPDSVSTTSISLHVRELAEAQADLAAKRRRLHELESVLERAFKKAVQA